MSNDDDSLPVDQIFPAARRPFAIAKRQCIPDPYGCGLPVGRFSDETSEREYEITGLCQSCQDKFYAALADYDDSFGHEDEPTER